jgi:hexosaminidase
LILFSINLAHTLAGLKLLLGNVGLGPGSAKLFCVVLGLCQYAGLRRRSEVLGGRLKMGIGHWIQGVHVVGFAMLLCAAGASAQEQPRLNLMPYPANLQTGNGSLRIDSSFSVALTGHTEARLDRAVQRFLRQLSRQTALPIPVNSSTRASTKPTLTLHTNHASKEVQELGEDESYALSITADGAQIDAPTPLGAMHGLQTFLQLVEVSPDGFTAPALIIHDKPRFPWRGLMIDVGRHFIPLDVLRRNLDGLEAVKMNVFHWHLSEDQGFRVESRKFPKLQTLGSDGLYYTQDEIRDLIAYARDRGIRVVPEFDMPGHSTAWFVGYPELASGPGPYEIERKWGVFDPAMDLTSEKTYKFLDEFVGEMTKLFPDHYFHIGGDEVNGKQWDANPKIQGFKKSRNFATNEALQAYFSERIQKIVSKHGKAVVGWDEVFIPGVPKDIVIQSWRGQESLAKAAALGYHGILSNGYYLDLGWSTARHYAVDPISGPAASLTPGQQQLILGGESCMWVEYVNAENIDSRIWPRNAAIAERLWSPQNITDVASMYARLHALSAQLEWLGLTHRAYYPQMLRRIAGPAASPEELLALRTLADVVEPVKDYTREATATAEPTSATPLNRVVDAVPLESDVARRFGELVDRFVASSCRDAEATARLRGQLSAWRDNDGKLQPLLQRSFLVKEVAATSQDLSSLAAVGVAALDFAAKGGIAPEDWKKQQLAVIEQIEKPKSQLLVMPAPAIQKLVEAVAVGGSCAASK